MDKLSSSSSSSSSSKGSSSSSSTSKGTSSSSTSSTSKGTATKSTPKSSPSSPPREKFENRDGKREGNGVPNAAQGVVQGLRDTYRAPKAAAPPQAAPPPPQETAFRSEVDRARGDYQQRVQQQQGKADELRQQQQVKAEEAARARAAAEALPPGPERGKALKAAKAQETAVKAMTGQINRAATAGADAHNALQNIQRMQPAPPEGLRMSPEHPWFDKGLGAGEGAKSLTQHFEHHGSEVGATSEGDYASRARRFGEAPPRGTQMLSAPDSPSRVLYNPESRMLGVYSQTPNGKYTPITYHQVNPESPEFPRGHRAPSNTHAFLESRLEGPGRPLTGEPAVPRPATAEPAPVEAPRPTAAEPTPARTGPTPARVAEVGLGALGVGLGGYQTYHGLHTLANANNADQVVAGAANTTGGAANTASGVAALRGAGALASRLGGVGGVIDGASDLYRGVRTGDREALALGGIKAAAGAAMFFPGIGTAVGGAVLLGAAAYQNREWLGNQLGRGWSAVRGLWGS